MKKTPTEKRAGELRRIAAGDDPGELIGAIPATGAVPLIHEPEYSLDAINERVRTGIDRLRKQTGQIYKTTAEIFKDLRYVKEHKDELIPDQDFTEYLEEFGIDRSNFYRWLKAAEWSEKVGRPHLIEKVDPHILATVSRMDDKTQKKIIPNIETVTRADVKKWSGTTQEIIDKNKIITYKKSIPAEVVIYSPQIEKALSGNREALTELIRAAMDGHGEAMLRELENR